MRRKDVIKKKLEYIEELRKRIKSGKPSKKKKVEKKEVAKEVKQKAKKIVKKDK